MVDVEVTHGRVSLTMGQAASPEKCSSCVSLVAQRLTTIHCNCTAWNVSNRQPSAAAWQAIAHIHFLSLYGERSGLCANECDCIVAVVWLSAFPGRTYSACHGSVTTPANLVREGSEGNSVMQQSATGSTGPEQVRNVSSFCDRGQLMWSTAISLAAFSRHTRRRRVVDHATSGSIC